MFYHCSAPDTLNCTGSTCTSSGAIECVEISVSYDELSFITENVTSENIAFVFTWSFGAILGMYLLGFTASCIRKALSV